MESGVKHPLMEPVAGTLRRVKQDNAQLILRPNAPRRYPRVPVDTDILSLNAQSLATRRELRADAERIQNELRQLIVAIDHLELIENLRASPARSSDETSRRSDHGYQARRRRRR